MLRPCFVLLPYGFTLFSNQDGLRPERPGVLLPYGFTLFSNIFCFPDDLQKFYYLMDLHYSQTTSRRAFTCSSFYYLMDLHYSQTQKQARCVPAVFYYLMDLHYSQTKVIAALNGAPFYYLMDLHYSQTDTVSLRCSLCFTTLWIYTILKHFNCNHCL